MVVVVQAGSASIERLLRVLDRIVPPAAAAARGARRYALVAAGAAAVIAIFLFRDGPPDSGGKWLATFVVLALAAGPPAMLFLFSEALRALAELPVRIRALPTTGREHASELSRLADRARRARGGGLLRLPVVLWRLIRLAASSRETLLPYAPILPLASLPFLGLAAFAAVAALVEILVALALLVALAAG
jgi:hypothetical protein